MSPKMTSDEKRHLRETNLYRYGGFLSVIFSIALLYIPGADKIIFELKLFSFEFNPNSVGALFGFGVFLLIFPTLRELIKSRWSKDK